MLLFYRKRNYLKISAKLVKIRFVSQAILFIYNLIRTPLNNG